MIPLGSDRSIAMAPPTFPQYELAEGDAMGHITISKRAAVIIAVALNISSMGIR
jgi:hypothetical protein